MFRILPPSSAVLCGILPFGIPFLDSDYVNPESKTAQNAKKDFQDTNESGRDRLFYMFSTE